MNRIVRSISNAALAPLRRENEDAVMNFVFPMDFVGFQGHFPGYPILPAVVQIMMAAFVAEESVGYPLRLLAVKGAKFMVPLGPDQEIEVHCRVTINASSVSCRATLRSSSRVAASFLITQEKWE